MADNVLRVGAEFDVSPIIAGAKIAGDSIKNLNNDIGQQAARFAASGVTGNELVNVLQNLGYSSKESQAAVASLGLAEEITAVETQSATAAMTGFERAAALAGGRILGMEAGLGMAGGALARVASYLPGLGTAFIFALPVALVSEMVDKIEQYELGLAKADREVKEFAISSEEMSASIEKENLKLDDQILKMEKRPERNLLKIGLIEAQEAAEKLSKSLEESMQKANDLLNVGIGGAIFSLFTGGGRADEKQYAEKIQPILNQIQDVRQKLASIGPGATASQTNAALEEEIGLYKQEQRVLEDSIRDMEAGQGSSQIHAQSIARFKEELIGATEAVTNLGIQEVQTGLIVSKSVEEQKVNVLDYWKQFSIGFAKAAEEMAKSDAMWKKFWADRDADAIKSAAEQGKIAEEASKRWMELMDHAGEQIATRNIENARAEATTVEEIFRKMQEQRDTAATGHAGIFLDVTKTELAEQQMKVLDVQITTTDETIKKLQSDVAVLNRQPFISEGDQKQIQRYADEIKALEGLLQRLQTEHQKLGQVVTTVWQDIHKAEEQAVSTFFTTFNSQFVRMMETGQSFSKVMISAWNSMVGSFVTAVLKMGEQWVATEILKLTTTQTTNAAITANTLSQNLVQRFDSAKTAAAKAMASVGFPLDLAVGPLVFAAALAFEKGGVVPGMGAVPAIVHGGERVLTSSQNTTLERIANSTTNNSGSINMENHFHGNTFSADQTGRELMRMAKRGKLQLSR